MLINITMYYVYTHNAVKQVHLLLLCYKYGNLGPLKSLCKFTQLLSGRT